MKIGEKITFDGDKMITQRTYDPNPTLRQAQVLRDQREAGGSQISDGVHVARLPKWLIEMKRIEKGVKYDDLEGMRKLVEDIVTDPQYSQFRIWGKNPF